MKVNHTMNSLSSDCISLSTNQFSEAPYFVVKLPRFQDKIKTWHRFIHLARKLHMFYKHKMTLAELTFCTTFQTIIIKICHICHDRSCIGTITKNQIKYLSMKRQEKQKKICITLKSYMSKKG